jgi:hypothetical protein
MPRGPRHLRSRKITTADLKLGVAACSAIGYGYDKAHCLHDLGKRAVKRGASAKVRDEGKRLIAHAESFWARERRHR